MQIRFPLRVREHGAVLNLVAAKRGEGAIPCRGTSVGYN